MYPATLHEITMLGRKLKKHNIKHKIAMSIVAEFVASVSDKNVAGEVSVRTGEERCFRSMRKNERPHTWA